MRAALRAPHDGLFPGLRFCLVVLLASLSQVAAGANDRLAPSGIQASAPTNATSGTTLEQLPGDVDASVLALPTTHDHIGRVLVPVAINGQGPFRFIVDTGANHSTISPRLVRTLGLTPTATTPILVDGVTGSAQASFVHVDRMQSGVLSFGATTLPVVAAPVMDGADGILGAAGLNEQTLLIDFQRNRVEIARRVDFLARSQSTRIHAMREASGLIALDVRVGRIPVHAVIDTGSERTLGNLALRDALGASRKPGAVAMLTSVYGATEEVEPGELRTAPTITLDDSSSVRINGLTVVFGNFHIFKVWDLQARPAMVLGMDVLGTVASLSIDFKNTDIYFTSSPSLENPLGPGSGASLGDSSQKH